MLLNVRPERLEVTPIRPFCLADGDVRCPLGAPPAGCTVACGGAGSRPRLGLLGGETWNQRLVCALSRFSRVRLFAAPWIVARQAPPSMGISRREYWSGLPFPSPGIFPTPGLNPESAASPASQADSLLLSQQGSRP